MEFFQGWADDIRFAEKKIWVEDAARGERGINAVRGLDEDGERGHADKGKVFELSYDKLIVAVGCYSQTFGTKGVRENALFLKDVIDARKIRKRILECELGLMGRVYVLHGSADVEQALKRLRCRRAQRSCGRRF